MSTKTGVAPVDRIELTVALNVWPTVMTSSPGPSPRPSKMHISATVPLLTAIACFVPMIRGEPFLELRDFATAREHPALEDLGDGGDLFGPDVRPCDGDHAGGRRFGGGAFLLAERVVAGQSRKASITPRAAQFLVGRLDEPFAADADPADGPGRVPGDEGVRRDVVGDDRAGPDHRVRADVAAGDDDGTGPDRGADRDVDRADRPVGRPGEIARRVQRSWPTIVGQDRARPDEHAVATVTPW